MYLTLQELMVLIDSAMGSLSVPDKYGIWRFTVEQRGKVADSLIERMNEVRLRIVSAAGAVDTQAEEA